MNIIETWNTITTVKYCIIYYLFILPKRNLTERISNLESGGLRETILKFNTKKEIVEMFLAAGKVIEINGEFILF